MPFLISTVKRREIAYTEMENRIKEEIVCNLPAFCRTES